MFLSYLLTRWFFLECPKFSTPKRLDRGSSPGIFMSQASKEMYNKINQSELREKVRHLCRPRVASAGKMREKNHVVAI